MNILSIESDLIIDWAHEQVVQLKPHMYSLNQAVIAIAVRSDKPQHIKEYLVQNGFKDELEEQYSSFIRNVTHRNRSTIQLLQHKLQSNLKVSSHDN